MKTNMVILANHREASLYAAKWIAEVFLEKPEPTAVFAAGDTPMACYKELIRRQSQGEVRLDRAFYIGLDEWMGLGPGDAGSCIASMNRGYYEPAAIPRDQIAFFDGLTADPAGECRRMEGLLRQHPLDLAVLGVGVNGHIGFNEPEATPTGDFSIVSLSETTQTVGRKYFSGESTPTQGATITLKALRQASRVLILATGESKREAVRRILAGETDFPAGAFLDHPGAVYVVDQAAAGAGK